MSNFVEEVLYDVSKRTGMDDYSPILRAMRRLYSRLNRDLHLVDVETTFTFSAADIASEINYKALPSGWIRPFRMSPKRHWRDPSIFQNDEIYTYTTYKGNIYFANAADGDSFLVGYYSSGGKLVDKADADLGTDEINDVEWGRAADLNQILLYGTAIDVANDYKMYQSDLAMFQKLRADLKRSSYDRQATDPEISGPQARRSDTLDYGMSGTS